MKYNAIDTVIVSGGMIQKDFALDFIRKIEEKILERYTKRQKLQKIGI